MGEGSDAMSELSNCPDCGGECRQYNVGGSEWVECVGCDCYTVIAGTKAKAIAHHERLAGRCRWVKGGDMTDSGQEVDVWTPGCGPGYAVTYIPPFCEDCGKHIEEVKA